MLVQHPALVRSGHPEARAGAPRHPHLQCLIGKALKAGPRRAAIAFPCSENAVEAAVAGRRMDLIEPLMVGPRTRIEAIAAASGLDTAGVQFVETGDDPAAAARAAVALCRDGAADLIMKGSLHTDELLAAVVARDDGLRTERRVSHTFVFDLPGQAQPLLMADCVVNISPGLAEKRDITQNAIDLAHTLGIDRPYAAILSAIETINPAIPGTLDAAVLSKMAERGQITGATVEGPLSFDVAISLEAARIKGMDLRRVARPDILIMPNLEAGNMLYKQLVYVAHAECAGIVLGTRVPIVLTSRADSAESRVASCALAVLHAQHRT
ncbi:MAG TPA: bifunctional enoyl-CoA hydratase/phosphate acetyltransferase [Usitatibacter sp.]|nr:bifunctional enoyl-CoA hydratase/phosphate acetyltransferase [Usitatibacter sp.]